MPSQKLLNQLLDAYYEAESSSPQTQEEAIKHLNQLLDQALAGTMHTKADLIEAIRGKYIQYIKTKNRRSRLTI